MKIYHLFPLILLMLISVIGCKSIKSEPVKKITTTGVIHISLTQKTKPEKFVYKYQDYQLTKLKFTSRSENNWTFSYDYGKLGPDKFLALIKSDKRVLDAYYIKKTNR